MASATTTAARVVVLLAFAGFTVANDAAGFVAQTDDGLEISAGSLPGRMITVSSDMKVTTGGLVVGDIDVLAEINNIREEFDQKLSAQNESMKMALSAQDESMKMALAVQDGVISALNDTLMASQDELSNLRSELAEQKANTSELHTFVNSEINNLNGEIEEVQDELIKASEGSSAYLEDRIADVLEEVRARFDTLNDTHGYDTAGRCDAIKCDKLNHYIDNSEKKLCKGHICEHDECCEANPTCEKFECPRGYTDNDSLNKTKRCPSGICDPSDCCNTNPKCSRSYNCPSGWVLTDDFDRPCDKPSGCEQGDCCRSKQTLSWVLSWSGYSSGRGGWDYGRSPKGIHFSMTDRNGKKVSNYIMPEVGTELTFTIRGVAGTAKGKTKTVTGKVEKIVMPNESGGYLTHGSDIAFQFIGTDIRNKMNQNSVHFDAMFYGSSTVRNGRSLELWHCDFELGVKP